MWHTSDKRWPLFLLAALYYPIAELLYLFVNPGPGLSHAELLMLWGVGVFGEFGILLLVYFWLVCIVLHRYPGAVPLVAANHLRPYWTISWSILFGALAAISLYFLFSELLNQFNVFLVLHNALGIYLALCFRSAVIFRQPSPSLLKDLLLYLLLLPLTILVLEGIIVLVLR